MRPYTKCNVARYSVGLHFSINHSFMMSTVVSVLQVPAHEFLDGSYRQWLDSGSPLLWLYSDGRLQADC
jgi:hypothetical protein